MVCRVQTPTKRDKLRGIILTVTFVFIAANNCPLQKRPTYSSFKVFATETWTAFLRSSLKVFFRLYFCYRIIAFHWNCFQLRVLSSAWSTSLPASLHQRLLFA